VVRQLSCDACQLRIADGAPVLFAIQQGGAGPCPGQCGWYTATVHADPCGAALREANFTAFLRDGDREYRQRTCRGCSRVMWLRRGSRRSHCSSPCRQADYRRRRDLSASAIREGRVLYRDDLYWMTRPNPVTEPG
jgi:hypothetical protein